MTEAKFFAIWLTTSVTVGVVLGFVILLLAR